MCNFQKLKTTPYCVVIADLFKLLSIDSQIVDY